MESRKWATLSSVSSLLSCPAGKAGVGGPLPSDLLVEQAGQNSGRSHSLACYVGTPALGVFILSYTTALLLPSENPQPHPSQVNTPFPAFELWCWRRLLRVSRTARRSNQSILKEINPEFSLEGQPKTRPDSPVPSLQGPCDRSLKSEVACGSCLNWR